MSVSSTTIISWDTLLTADCIEFCPFENYENYFALGTYQLEGDERHGLLYILKLQDDILVLITKVSISGIFDLKWLKKLINDEMILTVATANGSLQMYKFKDTKLSHINSLDVTDGHALYIDFSNKYSDHDDPFIITSDSKGNIHLCDLNDGISIKKSIKAHNFEAWIATFDKENSNIIYSGGDDAIFKAFDIRMSNPSLVCNEHTAGVTHIVSWPHKDNIIVTGSYDEHVRIFDKRKMRNSILSNKIGGGVWRIQPHYNTPHIFATACMYEGFKLCNLTENKIEEFHHYKEHNSIAYGID